MTDKTKAPDQDALTAAQNAHQSGYNALEGTGLHEHTREALELMAHEGLSLPLAAKQKNIRVDNLQRAFNKPKVRAAFNQLVKTIRDNASQMAYLRINHLSQASQSERMTFDAARWVAGVDGLSPVQKVQGTHSHSISFGGFEYPDLEAKDVTPED